MSSNYNKSFRSIDSLTVHIVFVTKYRKKVITFEILQQLNKIFDETCQKWECELVEFNGEVDHVHLLITFNPKVQLSKFIANLKTVSSRLIRRDFGDYLGRFYRKPVLWTGSYFVASCGSVTIEQLKEYVEHQSTPI